MFVQAGKLNGPFRGFNNKQTRFTFANGVTWRQNELKYVYFYANSPRAKVTYQTGTYTLEVEGMNETVSVVEEL